MLQNGDSVDSIISCHSVTKLLVILAGVLCQFKIFSEMTSRNWCITINNPVCFHFDQASLLTGQMKLFIWQYEKGVSGTLHIQGYAEFCNPVRLAHLKKVFPTCHAEIRKGSRLQAVEYVTKEESRETGPFLVHQDGITLSAYLKGISTSGGGNNSKMMSLKAMLDEGCSESDIADMDFSSWVRHYKAFRAYKLLKAESRNSFDKLIIVIGPSGTGKSKFARDQYPDAYWKQRSNWWDGYSTQSVVILDEFYGWLSYDLLLRLCDRYPLLLETKGGQVECVATTVVITSNLLPADWYKNVYRKSLQRRISTIMYMPELGKTEHFLSYESFIKANIQINDD